MNVWKGGSLFVYTEWSVGGLAAFIDSCITAGITVAALALGAVAAFLLLIITAPSVGEEWPSYVPGTVNGDEVVIMVEGSYGQGHITERAKNGKDSCTRTLCSLVFLLTSP